IHDQSGIRIFLELPAFVAGVVGKKNEPALIKVLQQHDARGWFSIHARSHRHRISIMDSGFNRSGEPGVELLYRIGIEIGASQSYPNVLVSEYGVIARSVFKSYLWWFYIISTTRV